ncbi:TetR/AcrR family transcriptional regulator [Erythrobacter oryzae]|uniref:TetR/AcrR family transcriptional regulator n=1 Tax=Erythrobacter oryzae TaxID=3019556 RepID=UPI00255474DD|nr:TetR/AcrR family transcriptional regulator [Erythrobacter sp. COR-2]
MGAATNPSRAADTRNRLIDAALVVVARDGLGEANVKAIAQEAGVTAGLLHYHFASKDELLFAAVERAGAEYVAALDELIAGHEPAALFDAYLTFAAGALDAHRPLFALRLALAVRAINEPAMAERLAGGDAAIAARLAQVLARHGGRSVPVAEDEAGARMIKAAFEGLMLSWLSRPGFPMEGALSRFAAAVRATV